MKKLSALVGAFVLVLSLAIGMSAYADSGARTYTYLLGTSFLCGLDPSACPDIARAPNGDTVTITGAGTFSIHPKSVTGGGGFVHKNAAGAVLVSGTWTATQLLAFHSFGNQPDLPPELEGGHALIRVHLSPGFDAILQVDCAIGKVPPGHGEGVRLAVQNVLNFNEKVSGFTVFIRMP